MMSSLNLAVFAVAIAVVTISITTAITPILTKATLPALAQKNIALSAFMSTAKQLRYRL